MNDSTLLLNGEDISKKADSRISAVATVLLITKTSIVKYYDRRRERQRETDRQRQRDRHTDRDRQTDRDTERERERQTVRQTDGDRDRGVGVSTRSSS